MYPLEFAAGLALKQLMSGRSMSVSTTASSGAPPYDVDGGVMVENAAYALPRHSIPTDILAAISDDLAFAITECIIDPQRLKLGESIGRGQSADSLPVVIGENRAVFCQRAPIATPVTCDSFGHLSSAVNSDLVACVTNLAIGVRY